ncbi:hypothetical protein BVRB_4g078940 [Beta vulgaris subsp. vulgaris]|nr:hypothetical protein BVRB_4g078940 [Beta vulgaris subsp. vulgaris]
MNSPTSNSPGTDAYPKPKPSSSTFSNLPQPRGETKNKIIKSIFGGGKN